MPTSTKTRRETLPIRLSRPPLRSEDTTAPYAHTAKQAQTWNDLPQAPERQWDRCSISATHAPSAQWTKKHKDIDIPLPTDAPTAKDAARAFALHSLDILLGHRPASVLRPWLAPEIFAVLARRASLALRVKGRAPQAQRPRIQRIFLYPVRERAVEASIVAHDGKRGRAIAMRLEYWKEKWHVVALEIG